MRITQGRARARASAVTLGAAQAGGAPPTQDVASLPASRSSIWAGRAAVPKEEGGGGHLTRQLVPICASVGATTE